MLYLHIPFCKTRCAYCDFYSTAGHDTQRREYINALLCEMRQRRPEWGDTPCSTVYIGGGTPSWLGSELLTLLLDGVRELYPLAPDAEITVECNPDDITPAMAHALLAMGANRVSLGIQTFDDKCLRLIGRRHSGREARRAVELLSTTGIENISIDLIYGLPGQTLEKWREDVTSALALPVTHLSAYALMYEPGTPLTALRAAGRIIETDDETQWAMFRLLRQAALDAGMEHYEISNFARPGFHSRHNSAYWDGHAYLGFGPGAHSYDGAAVRRANRPDLAAYLAAPGTPPHDTECLTAAEQQDDYVFTALRTARGLSLVTLRERFGDQALRVLVREAERHLRGGRLVREGDRLRLTEAGIFVSDDVMSDLMTGGEAE